MIKLYDLYVKKKEDDSNKYYLFKSGKFYIFLDEDARKISKISLLKVSDFGNSTVKCGFPGNSLDKYMDLFSNLGIDVEIIENHLIDKDAGCIDKKIIKKIKGINIDKTTPLKALNILNELRVMIDERL